MGNNNSKFIYNDPKLKEECAVAGIISNKTIDASVVFSMLNALQHRGQESSGIFATGGKPILHKEMGLVSQVYNTKILENLSGNVIIGHNRYSTSGTSTIENAQPLIAESKYGEIALAHNGNISTPEKCCQSCLSDSHRLLNLIAERINQHTELAEAIINVLNKCCGAYSILIATPEFLIAARDSYGIRPLCLGITEEGEHVITSETCALDAINAKYLRDVNPGELLIIDKNQNISTFKISEEKKDRFCILELVYFSRPDSLYKNQSIYTHRFNMGRALAKSDPVKADIVIPIPNSGTIAAIGYAKESGIQYCEAINENRYTGRTFILPNQKQRLKKIQNKYNIISDLVRDKKVIIVDDSIVRGNTSISIVKMLKDIGAEEVHVRISSPPLKHPCIYGIDIDKAEELIANDKTIEQMKKTIDADSLAFLNLHTLHKTCSESATFCDACMSGEYPI